MEAAQAAEAHEAPAEPDAATEHPAFAEELPPDFWNEPPPPAPSEQGAPQGVRAHPLFAELQSLFPGRIVEEHKPQSPGKQEGDASDATALGELEAVDLEPSDDDRDA
jgi:hypothetical protein